MLTSDADNKLLKVFGIIHGESALEGAEIIQDDEFHVIAVGYFKDGQECWRATLSELAFEYATRDLEVESE